MYCEKCGALSPDDAQYCSACGSALSEAKTVTRQMALANPAEGSGGLSEAMASSKSHSRMRLSPLILLVLILSLLAGTAFAALYIYPKIIQPMLESNEEQPAKESIAAYEVEIPELSRGSQGSSSASATNYHYEAESFEFDLPDFWKGKVHVETRDDEMRIMMNGYDADWSQKRPEGMVVKISYDDMRTGTAEFELLENPSTEFDVYIGGLNASHKLYREFLLPHVNEGFDNMPAEAELLRSIASLQAGRDLTFDELLKQGGMVTPEANRFMQSEVRDRVSAKR